LLCKMSDLTHDKKLLCFALLCFALLCFDKQIQNLICVLFSQKAAAAAAPSLSQATTHLQRLVLQGLRGVDLLLLLLLLLQLQIAFLHISHSFFVFASLALSLSSISHSTFHTL
jgi:hypothetical protein